MSNRPTLLQYQKNEHLLHFCMLAAFLPHPWHVLRPANSTENFWTSSLNASNLDSDTGKICHGVASLLANTALT
jgi:hypothetical protein